MARSAMNGTDGLLRDELASIAVSAGSVEQRAQELLEVLHSVVPYAAAWMAVRDPESRRHRPVATEGDIEPLARYFALPEADDEVEELGLNRLRPPMCASDLPAPLAEIRAWGEYLLPAGFRDGFAMGLFSDDGRHLGFISLLTDDPAERTTAYCGLVEAVRPLLAQALDRLPSLASVARLTGDAVGGVALTRAGRTLPLPGLPEHPLLAPASTVIAVARQHLTAPGAHVSFLCPFHDVPGGLVRITALDCRDQPPDHLTAVVWAREGVDARGLLPADLQVLGALLHGWREEQVAAAFPGPSVRSRLRLMATKMPARSPGHLLLRAAREGCFIPPALWPTPLIGAQDDLPRHAGT